MAKYLMSERTAAWVRSQMDRKAPSAAAGVTRCGRPAFAVEDAFAHPFEVRFASSLGDGEPGSGNAGKWIVWLPSDSVLIVNGEPIDVTEELEPAGEPYPEGWYVLDFLGAEGGDVYLNVHVNSGEEKPGVTASFSAAPEEAEEGETVYPILIAECAERSVKATVDSAIVLGGNGVSFDKVSIDRVTAEDAKDPSAIQIKNFDNSASDGKQGLVQRIRVVKDGEDSYHLEADGDVEVFIVARVKGKLKYIPLTGAKDKDEDERNAEDPCDHPGDRPGTGKEGGVPVDEDDQHGGGEEVPVGDGGIPADGDVHAGEPCPDCSPTGPGVLAE